MHQYLDSDGSGTSAECVSSTIGVERIAAATQWLKDNNKKGIIGEYAGGKNTQCMQAVTGLLDQLKANTDVWMGAMWWGGGPVSSLYFLLGTIFRSGFCSFFGQDTDFGFSSGGAITFSAWRLEVELGLMIFTLILWLSTFSERIVFSSSVYIRNLEITYEVRLNSFISHFP